MSSKTKQRRMPDLSTVKEAESLTRLIELLADGEPSPTGAPWTIERVRKEKATLEKIFRDEQPIGAMRENAVDRLVELSRQTRYRDSVMRELRRPMKKRVSEAIDGAVSRVLSDTGRLKAEHWFHGDTDAAFVVLKLDGESLCGLALSRRPIEDEEELLTEMFTGTALDILEEDLEDDGYRKER